MDLCHWRQLSYTNCHLKISICIVFLVIITYYSYMFRTRLKIIKSPSRNKAFKIIIPWFIKNVTHYKVAYCYLISNPISQLKLDIRVLKSDFLNRFLIYDLLKVHLNAYSSFSPISIKESFFSEHKKRSNKNAQFMGVLSYFSTRLTPFTLEIDWVV